MSWNPVHSYDDGRGNREVFLDGKLIYGVVFANEDDGIVEVICKDENGCIILDKSHSSSSAMSSGKHPYIRTELLHGKVKVVFV